MERSSTLMDILSILLSVLVLALAGVWLWNSNVFDTSLLNSGNLTWYLIRASGTTAFTLLTLSVLWGLAISSGVVKNWSPGPLTMLLHASLSWLALGFALGHGLLLLADSYFSYRLSDLLVPFTGPYRPAATGAGILAFWMLVVITPSFALKKRLMSHRAWKLLHYTSYIAFVLAAAHGLTAGTDGGKLGFQILFGASLLVSAVLLWYRIKIKQRPNPRAVRSAQGAALPGRS
ncbi:MAG TPA: ferric reductase-like transmembrane domain-containing protein [Aggregatilinea sp.]|uniref:ferric reductase-like transmembrane domain-containing protein n=1 Tax=Aggregatilinea sp. TaxID=2806333 RepID=UPI002C98272C|nr:ferric reductase-like transmembrane domain-containing protein [Aggregatilinea sp.]HML21380.1 ferric reductase-like transmembrane domain-containing protein [Aggregatilinea sp.]